MFKKYLKLFKNLHNVYLSLVFYHQQHFFLIKKKISLQLDLGKGQNHWNYFLKVFGIRTFKQIFLGRSLTICASMFYLGFLHFDFLKNLCIYLWNKVSIVVLVHMLAIRTTFGESIYVEQYTLQSPNCA